MFYKALEAGPENWRHVAALQILHVSSFYNRRQMILS